MEEIDEKERLWNEIKHLIDSKITSNNTAMFTKSQNKRFWVKKVTNSYIRIEREDSNMDYEDISKHDFIDLWIDLHNSTYIKIGYMQKDLHQGQNRHTAVIFSILAELPYISYKKIRNGLRYYLDSERL